MADTTDDWDEIGTLLIFNDDPPPAKGFPCRKVVQADGSVVDVNITLSHDKAADSIRLNATYSDVTECIHIPKAKIEEYLYKGYKNKLFLIELPEFIGEVNDAVCQLSHRTIMDGKHRMIPYSDWTTFGVGEGTIRVGNRVVAKVNGLQINPSMKTITIGRIAGDRYLSTSVDIYYEVPQINLCFVLDSCTVQRDGLTFKGSYGSLMLMAIDPNATVKHWPSGLDHPAPQSICPVHNSPVGTRMFRVAEANEILTFLRQHNTEEEVKASDKIKDRMKRIRR